MQDVSSLAVTADLPKPCDHEKDSTVEKLLEQLDPYIISQVKKMLYCHSYSSSHTLLGAEIDDITQRVRIKLWRALLERQIQHLPAYIHRIICNEFNDFGRRRKSSLTLSLDEEGELNCGSALVAISEGMDDPAREVEQQEAAADCVEAIARAVLALPPRQQLATICSLLDRVDDVCQLVKALKAHCINVETAQWPEGEADLHRLKASISVARRSMMVHMSVSLQPRMKLPRKI